MSDPGRCLLQRRRELGENIQFEIVGRGDAKHATARARVEGLGARKDTLKTATASATGSMRLFPGSVRTSPRPTGTRSGSSKWARSLERAWLIED